MVLGLKARRGRGEQLRLGTVGRAGVSAENLGEAIGERAAQVNQETQHFGDARTTGRAAAECNWPETTRETVCCRRQSLEASHVLEASEWIQILAIELFSLLELGFVLV